MKRLFFLCLLLVMLILAVGAWLLLSPLPVQQNRLVQVMAGTHFEQVVRDLEDEGTLGAPLVAQGRGLLALAYARVSNLGIRLQVGEYPLAQGDSLVDLLKHFAGGEVLQRSFTLVDGWNFQQVRQALDALPSLQHRLPMMTDAQVAQTLGLSQSKVEGWLAPNTYFYTLGDSDIGILKRAHKHQEQILSSQWDQRAPGLPYKTPYQALIMASLVEKETAAKTEMPVISGVFVARLEKGMRLQTDPTIIYAMGSRYHGKIGYRDLKIDSPYNTYLHYGLPPGPIAMPGKGAIEAALHPAATDALYFVAKGDGTHVFSHTLEQQNAAVRRYQLHRGADYRSTPGSAPASSRVSSAAEVSP